MSDAQPDLRDQGLAFLNGFDDLMGENALLKIDNDALHRQSEIITGDNERLRAELERAVGKIRSLLDEKMRLTRILTSAGRTITDGIRDIPEDVTQLRGVPTRKSA